VATSGAVPGRSLLCFLTIIVRGIWIVGL
jgi:hypothetical protein